jgi:hypothetical protein
VLSVYHDPDDDHPQERNDRVLAERISVTGAVTVRVQNLIDFLIHANK